MGIWTYIQLVLARAWSETWAAVIRHDRGTFIRDLLMAILSLFLLVTMQGWLIKSGAMSEDNTKDTVIWAILGLIAIVAAFSLMFVFQALIFSPHAIWRDQEKAIYNLLPAYQKKRRQPFISESPKADTLRDELSKFGNDRVVSALKALTSAQLAAAVSFRTFLGGPPFGEACIQGLMQQTTELHEDLSDITFLDYLQRHQLSEIESKLLKAINHYEKLQLTLYQTLETLTRLGGSAGPETIARLVEWKATDDAMNAGLDALRGRVGLPTVNQITGRKTRALCASAYIP